MQQLEFILRFDTPAFLGNAEQSGQWRTPPIKAQLRQWWRVAYAAANNFPSNVAAMRRDEGRLFGVASDGEGDSRKSQVRIRLDRWDEGSLKKTQWQALASVSHPEVSNPVSSDLYLGYGPVTLRGTPTLKANAAIQAGESATLSIAVPDSDAHLIEHALMLMHGYGTVGGRSRNGWGSYALLPLPQSENWGEDALPLRPWKDCLKLDWPHAIGKDEKGALIWQTAPSNDWKAVMKQLAQIKIGLRTQFKFPNVQPPHHQVEDRHWLSYPITNHTTKAWNRNARLPNSLRFKVRQTENGQWVGVIFHVPCRPPEEFDPDMGAIQAVWQNIHTLLDELSTPIAGRTYRNVADTERRTTLKLTLDTLALQRVPE